MGATGAVGRAGAAEPVPGAEETPRVADVSGCVCSLLMIRKKARRARKYKHKSSAFVKVCDFGQFSEGKFWLRVINRPHPNNVAEDGDLLKAEAEMAMQVR